ncbi:hypothetical protein [Catellatospora chokoriensis]|uniref:hypothetical protein n=1 Tax=Catellatospora chokoriensis TaxID=310353 RepID=UPI001786E8E1|nr:hypothetical protein [Catellatospora chokoriensis]
MPEVIEALYRLAEAGFVEARPGEVGWHLEQVCPLTYQVLGIDPPPAVHPPAVSYRYVTMRW